MTPRGDDQATGAWEALHQGHDREAFDSPARFELSRVSTVVGIGKTAPRRRHAAAPVPAPAEYSPSAYAPSGQRRSRVRPYARTGGRTHSPHNLALEALVSTTEKARRFVGVGSPEHRAICDVCLETRSVAEIAAHLYLPLGVVKVLVGDMADAGLVIVHQPGMSLDDQGSRDFMERVLQGLRAL
jgi:hypothetical protein